MHRELYLLRLLLIQSSSSTGHNATGSSPGLMRELNQTEVGSVLSVLTWWYIRGYIQICGPSCSLLLIFLTEEHC